MTFLGHLGLRLFLCEKCFRFLKVQSKINTKLCTKLYIYKVLYIAYIYKILYIFIKFICISLDRQTKRMSPGEETGSGAC